MSKHRFELFSDGVFAIILTLLVLDLRVPEGHGLQALAEVWPWRTSSPRAWRGWPRSPATSPSP